MPAHAAQGSSSQHVRRTGSLHATWPGASKHKTAHLLPNARPQQRCTTPFHRMLGDGHCVSHCVWCRSRHAKTLVASATGAPATNRREARMEAKKSFSFIPHLWYPPDREHTRTRSPAVRNSSASARPMPVGGVEEGRRGGGQVRAPLEGAER